MKFSLSLGGGKEGCVDSNSRVNTLRSSIVRQGCDECSKTERNTGVLVAQRNQVVRKTETIDHKEFV
jgi:hypothetical protein